MRDRAGAASGPPQGTCGDSTYLFLPASVQEVPRVADKANSPEPAARVFTGGQWCEYLLLSYSSLREPQRCPRGWGLSPKSRSKASPVSETCRVLSNLHCTRPSPQAKLKGSPFPSRRKVADGCTQAHTVLAGRRRGEKSDWSVWPAPNWRPSPDVSLKTLQMHLQTSAPGAAGSRPPPTPKELPGSPQ